MRIEPGSALVELLEEERRHLLSGNVQAVAELVDRKSELAEAISADPSQDVDLSRKLRELARRNQDLLSAVQRGLRAAEMRLKEIRKAANHLDTYTSRGQRADLGAAMPSFEKRA